MAKVIVFATGGLALLVLGLIVWFAWKAESAIPPRGQIVIDATGVGGLESSGR